jgi:hypothetical protein
VTEVLEKGILDFTHLSFTMNNMTSDPPDKASPRPRRLRFGLRTLFVVIAVVGVVLVWFAWRLEATKEQRRLIAEIEASGGEVMTHFGGHWYSFTRRNLINGSIVGVRIRRPDFSDLSLLADQKRLIVIDLAGTQVRDISPLAQFTRVTWLSLANTNVSDLSPVADMKALHHLDLSGTRVTDVSPLAGLQQLEIINLSGTQVTDLSPLRGRPRWFDELDLSNTPISDISDLMKIAHVQKLNLSGTRISAEDVAKLQQQFPHCTITCQPPSSQTGAVAPMPPTAD